MDMEEHAKEVAQILKLIANENRLMILCALEEGEHTVSEIHDWTGGISMAALSQHLSQLKLAGLIENEKKGQNVYYRLKDSRIRAVMGVLKETYCKT